MATPSAILSVLVNADTAAATANLTKYDRQLKAVDDVARKGIETRLGATVDQTGFKAYEARLAKTAQIAKDRAAFKAELGANFNNAGFLAYERAIDKAKREAAAGVAVQVKITDAIQRLNDLQVRMGRIPDKIDTKVEVDTGVATAKLDLLQRKIRDVERDIAGGGGGGRGGFLASLFGGGGGQAGGISGLLPGGGTAPIPGQLLAGLAPFAAGGIGSATAVAGSAGAAALGAGALGTGALGVGAAGLGPILALSGGMKDAIKLSTKLQVAQDKLGGAQKLFGDKSKQAAAAQLAVNKIMAAADPAVLKFAQSWGKFTEVLDKAQQSVLPAFSKALAPVLDVVSKLLPTIVQMAKIDLGGIGKGIAPLLSLLKSADVKTALLALSRTFAQLAVPIGQAATSLLTAFLHVAVAAAPFLVQIADAFARWAKGFSDSLTPGAQLNSLIGGLVGQLKSWWELAKSIGGLMVTIFSAGAGTGQTLVNLLTQVVTQFNTWLNTKSGQDAMKAFFRNSADLVVALFRAFGPLIGAVIKLAIDVMPTFTRVLDAMRPALRLIAGLIGVVADALKNKLVQAVAVAALVFLPGGAIILGLVALGSLLRNLPGIIHALRNAWRAVWDAMKIAFNTSLSFILGGLSSLLGAIKFLVDTANIKLPGIGHLFGNLGTSTSKHLGDAQTAIDNYRRTLTNAANRAKTDLGNIGNNTETMRDRVNAAVTKMTQSVQTGIVTADSALGREMKKLGVTVQQVLTGASSHPLQPKPAFYSGGMVTQPGYFAGEEAPQHPEVILATNPAYRSRNLGLWAQAGSMLGVPGFAQGGIAGNIGAMIAEANRVDAQHFPYLWGGGHGSFSGPFDCSGAVSDILHAGGVLNAPRVSGDFMNYGLPGPGPVTIYANPSHVYMSLAGKYFGTSGSNPGGGAGWFAGTPRPGFAVRHVGGSVDSIKTPEWTGPGGLLGKIGKKQVSLATKAANQTLSGALAQSFSGGFGGGDWGSSGPVARQIFDAFTALGYNKVAIAGIIGNAVQESGLGSASSNIFQFTPPIPGSSGSVATQAGLVAARGGNALRSLMNSAGSPAEAARLFMDNFEKPLASAANLPHRIAGAVQAFGQGYARGGIHGKVRRFANGGTFSSSKPKLVGGISKKGIPLPAGATVKGPQPLDVLAGYGTQLGNLESDLAGKLSQYSSLSGRFSVIEQGAEFFNPDGSVNAAGLTQQVTDDNVLLALAHGILGDYQAELPLVSTALTRFLGAKSDTGKRITVDMARINRNKLKIAANKRKEAGIRTALFALGRPSVDEVGALERQIAAAKLKYDPAVKSAEAAKASYRGHNKTVKARLEATLLAARGREYAAVHPLGVALNAARGTRAGRKLRVKQQSFDLRQQLRKLEGEDVSLATADTGLRAKIAGLKGILSGAGGASGENAIISSLETVASKLGTVLWGQGGKFLGIDTTNQGAAFDEQTTIDQLMNSLAALNAPPAGALATAANAPVTDPQTIAMLQQLLQQANQRTAVSEAQFNVLKTLPFGGSFATGGIVPGPVGAPSMIVAHGGEAVGMAPQVNINIAPGMEWIRDFIQVEIAQAGRGSSRTASRRLPGSTGR